MSDMESRLTEAMKARARAVEPRDEDAALDSITRRVDDRRHRALMVLGAAAAIAVVIGAIALIRRDETSKVNITTKPSTTTAPASTTTEVGPSPSIGPAKPAYLWPFNERFATPEAAAKSFAVDYLGMTLARVGKTIDEPVREVEVFPNASATARTLVEVVELPDDGWVVLGAVADEIKVDHPTAEDGLSSPLSVSGTSTAFEAQIALELRPIGSTTPVIRTSTMGGSNGEIGPFSTTITPPATDQPLVLLVYEADASDQGKMTKATVVRLEAAGAPEPTKFVAWTTDGQLTLLDFDGHLQQPITTSSSAATATLVYNTAGGAIGYGDRDEGQSSCGRSIFHRDENGKGINTSYVAGADLPAASVDGHEGYVTCDGQIFDHFALPGDQALTPPGSPLPVALTFVGNDVVAAYKDGTINMVRSSRTLPITSTVVTGRGRFGTLAFWDGTNISSYNPTTGEVVKLVQPSAAPISLDADVSGRHLLWVDVNHDLWKWSGGDPVKVGSGFYSAAW
jgi:hypothetical protein